MVDLGLVPQLLGDGNVDTLGQRDPDEKMHAVSVPPNYAAALLAVLAICAAAAVLAPTC